MLLRRPHSKLSEITSSLFGKSLDKFNGRLISVIQRRASLMFKISTDRFDMMFAFSWTVTLDERK